MFGIESLKVFLMVMMCLLGCVEVSRVLSRVVLLDCVVFEIRMFCLLCMYRWRNLVVCWVSELRCVSLCRLWMLLWNLCMFIV